MAFNMQDVLLEPYGGEILGLSVSATTLLTATWASGALLGFALAARWLARGHCAYRMIARGILIGLPAFSAVIFAAPMNSPALFYAGATGIGLGGGLFAVATLTAAMTMPAKGLAGRGLALGGTIRDGVNSLATSGALGEALATPATGYSAVYHLEIALLFVTLIALGPLVRLSFLEPQTPAGNSKIGGKIGLADFPT